MTTTAFSVIDRLSAETRKDTQNSILLDIFKRHGYDVPIPKRQLEKELGFAIAFKGAQFGEGIVIRNLQDIMALATELPGDLQRSLRTFHDKFVSYGLERDGEGENIRYQWRSITEEYFNWNRGVPRVPRNIFATDAERDAFVEQRNRKCEVCGFNTRLAVDHWRAHSVYRIDTPNIAVLLCEVCNNIHHNFDASKILAKKKQDTQCVKNWISIEKRIRDAGYLPNEDDISTQNQIIDEVVDYYQTTLGYSFADLDLMKL